MPKPLELLAPARNADIGREAIIHGADAVYIGAPSHGARAAAANSVEDIRDLARFAHFYGAKVYVALNTIIYDHELTQVQRTICSLFDAQVDALIVQDMGILRMDIPPIDLHASTQCDIRTPEKARFLAECGFSQLVLPREFSLADIAAVRSAVPSGTALEAFVHGALCVCYSGDCYASFAAKGRSANRGECAQMCRLPYSLSDACGRPIARDKHLLSLRDLCRLPHLEAMAQAGISSFKIEGRLKDAAYVKTTVAAYRHALDLIIEAHPTLYERASYGSSSLAFSPDVNKVFNRGFSSYFISSPEKPAHAPRDLRMANLDTPKWVGEEVATVVRQQGHAIVARVSKPLNNGDGLGFFDSENRYTGFLLNRVDSDRLFPASPVDVLPGTKLFRNRDIAFDSVMAQRTAQRTVPVEAAISFLPDTQRLWLSLKPRCGSFSLPEVMVCEAATAEAAKTPQKTARERALSKFGNTRFCLLSLSDSLPDSDFIPLSTFNSLRQKAVEALETAILALYLPKKRLPENRQAPLPYTIISYHDNVSNCLAEQFYRDHGATAVERAVEVTGLVPDTVMTSRYCLRRELGLCLRCIDPADRDAHPSPWYAVYLGPAGKVGYELSFDCAECLMHLHPRNIPPN